jgi:putative endonuclease
MFMPNSAKLKTGKIGEDLAAHFLQEIGYKIVARNYHTRSGEIDIIAQHNDVLIFVEVKTARTFSFGETEAWVDEDKQQRIGCAAEKYLYDFQIEDMDCRFDVITVDLTKTPPRLHHIKDAFWLEE